MNIAGLQKMTLLDYPGKVAATVFLGGCNFRCPYCHNASLVFNNDRTASIPSEEFFAFLQKRKGLLDGICVSGGEPLVHNNPEPFFAQIKDLGFSVKLDTNGGYPQKLQALVEKHLVDYVAMDVKNTPERYMETAGIQWPMVARIKESVAYLLSGPVPYEFRTTVVKSLHTLEDMVSIGQWIQGAPRYYLQNFRDSDDVLMPGLQGVDAATLAVFADAIRPFVPAVAIRGE